MAQSGFTPISLYYSSTGAAVPSAGNLVAGELALNTNDGKLYYKNSSGVVTLLAGATSGPAGGSTTQVQYNNAGVLAGITGATTNGTALTLIAPVLGTPASGNLVNATGYVGTSSLVTVGALNSGSITSGFGAIDVGADAISGGAATFTTGSFSGDVERTAAAGGLRGYFLKTSGVNRWGLLENATAESGSNAGSNFQITAYNDAGARIDEAMTINRATQAVQLNGSLAVIGAITTNAVATVTDLGNVSAFKFHSFVSNSAEAGNIIRVAQTAAVTFTATSDYRVKETFGPLLNASDLLRKLKVYDGAFNHDTTRRPLMLAHEIQGVTPWNVYGDKDAVNADGSMKLQTVSLAGQENLLVAGWQDLDTRLAAIEKQLLINSTKDHAPTLAEYQASFEKKAAKDRVVMDKMDAARIAKDAAEKAQREKEAAERNTEEAQQPTKEQ